MDTFNNRLVQEKPTSVTKISTSNNADDESKSNNKKLRPTGNSDVREWDIPKLQQDQEKSTPERQVFEAPAVKANESPAKGLDDYFRKTKAKPAIYWLPLTDEKVLERTRRQQQRKRDADENARSSNNKKDSKSTFNTNENTSSKSSSRRSPSPREKRRRISSSRSPPPRRDNKRHSILLIVLAIKKCTNAFVAVSVPSLVQLFREKILNF